MKARSEGEWDRGDRQEVIKMVNLIGRYFPPLARLLARIEAAIKAGAKRPFDGTCS